MELISILLWTVVITSGCMLWIWWKNLVSLQQIWDTLRYRIQTGLRVVGIHQLEEVQQDLHRLEQQVHARLAHLETAVDSLHQLQKDHQEISPPLVNFQPSEKATTPINLPFPRPRSVERNGLRFTLSDSIWSHLGSLLREDLDDDHIQNMVQGPFCHVCLKRYVGREDHAEEVPAQCRHCGAPWSNQGFNDLPISLLDLKRQVYLSLDQEFRASRRVQG